MKQNTHKTSRWVDADQVLRSEHAHFSMIECFASIVFLGLIVGIVIPLLT
ncbi:MAG: hypothetical protein HQ508_04290 [Candidatus Marinimicrobia bacterium]|nr:hypothetical protein [Candidatus Neomarinimicrobiota bacterium]